MKQNVRIALIEDLAAINRVVAEAAMAWPMAPRVKRLSLPVLLYSDIDMADYEILVYEADGDVLGVAAWDSHPGAAPTHLSPQGALFHGLYVRPKAQGTGIGRRLIDAVAERARQRGKDGLLIKAERVAVSYFKGLGLDALAPRDADDYPYQFWMPVWLPDTKLARSA